MSPLGHCTTLSPTYKPVRPSGRPLKIPAQEKTDGVCFGSMCCHVMAVWPLIFLTTETWCKFVYHSLAKTVSYVEWEQGGVEWCVYIVNRGHSRPMTGWGLGQVKIGAEIVELFASKFVLFFSCQKIYVETFTKYRGCKISSLNKKWKSYGS